MNIVRKNVVLGVAGALILQLAVITSAQEIGPSGEQVPETSALPAVKTGAAESSQSQGQLATSVSSSGSRHKTREGGWVGRSCIRRATPPALSAFEIGH